MCQADRRGYVAAPLENFIAFEQPGPAQRFLSTWILIAAGIFVVCLFGIMTRPAGFLAMVWPANALTLGLLLRMPLNRRASIWLAAPVAFMAADFVAGTDLTKALLLNAASLCGVAVAYNVARSIPEDALKMQEPQSALWLILIAAVGASVTGLFAAVADPVFLDLNRFDAWAFWFAMELVNYIAVLPLILSMPPMRRLPALCPLLASAADWRNSLPVATLIGSCALAMFAGGPGAIAFAVPALIWCGLTYSVFIVSVLAFTFASWSLVVISAEYPHDLSGAYDDGAIVSLRLAAFMIAVAPITLSIVMRNRDGLAQRLSVARQRVDMALEAGGIVATWDLDIATNTIMAEATASQSQESFCATQQSVEKVLANLIHPDDRKSVRDELDSSIAMGTNCHRKFRMVTPDGEVRWLAAFGKPVFDQRNSVSRLTGVCINLTEQAKAAEALALSDRRFNIVSESIPDIVWSTDGDGRHDYFNRRWREFTGIAPEDIEPETWVDLIHPEDRHRVLETWAACLQTGETYAIDYRFRYHDGKFRWLRVQAKPLRNAQDVIVRWYGTSTDIDDAKQLEAEREAVAGELDHRIGNLFALVNSLVNISVREGNTVPVVADAIRGRLKALHEAHSLVRRDNTGSTPIIALLRMLLHPYDDGSDRVSVAGDDVQIAASAVTPVALVFHELATNAVKHGALRDERGVLRVTLSCLDDRLIIDWTENCPSPSPAREGTGFGSRLFKAVVEGQLHGTAARVSTPDGLCIDMRVPLSSLVGS